MKYKAVIADVDGTLIEPNLHPAPLPSKRLKNAVEKCQKLGVVFSLASARSLSWVESLIIGFNLSSLLILENGAKLYDCRQKKYVWESILPKKQAEDSLKIIQKELKNDSSLQIIVVDDDQRLTSLKKIKKWKISKIVVLGLTSEKAEDLHKKLKINDCIHVTRSIAGENPVMEAVHVTNNTATKQVALNKLAEILGISTKEIIGIGDSYNDFPLLMACGLKVAMGNAVDDLKEIADYIAPPYTKDGVADVIEKFIVKS